MTTRMAPLSDKVERKDRIPCGRSFSVSRRAVINISAACVVLLVLVQAVPWWQARRIHLAVASRRAPGNVHLRPLTEGGTNKLPRLPEWKGQRSQLSGDVLLAASRELLC